MFTLFTLLLAWPGDVIDTETLLGKHEESLRRVYSISADIEWRVSEDNGKTWQLVFTYNVRRSGRRERVHRKQSSAVRDGKLKTASQFSDWLSAPDGQRTLVGLDPDHPPKQPVTMLSEHESHVRISGRVRAAQPFGPDGYKTAWGYPIFQPIPDHSLRELCQSSGTVRPSEGRDERGDKTWKLSLKAPESHVTCTVSLSPNHGYMICSSDLKLGIVEERLSVVEFQEVKEGIFIPSLIRGDVKNPNQLVEVSVRNIAVNSPVPEGEMTLAFPAGVAIEDEVNKCIYIWGDGKPLLTLANGAELNKWRQAKLREEIRESRGKGSWSLILVAVASVVLIALFVLKKRWSRAATAA